MCGLNTPNCVVVTMPLEEFRSIEELKGDLERARKRIETLESQNCALLASLDVQAQRQLRARLNVVEGENELLRKEVSGYIDNAVKMESQVEVLEGLRDQLRGDIDSLRKTIFGLTHKIKAMRSHAIIVADLANEAT